MQDQELVETPHLLRERHPLSKATVAFIERSRREIGAILAGDDARLLIVLGPCSLDDAVLDTGVPAVLRLAEQIHSLSTDPFVSARAKIVMRCPPAKPRTNVGWAGLEQTNLSMAHELLSNIANVGVPLAIEVMHERHFARYGEMLSLAWVGAREVNSTLLRHTVSAFPAIPTLFKNAEDGSIEAAVNAIKTAAEPHKVELSNQDGRLVRIMSAGNRRTGLIVRGGTSVRNPADFEHQLHKALATNRPVVVDCAHGNAVAHDENSTKSVHGQLDCLDHTAVLAERGAAIKGIMLETHLLAGADEHTPGRSRTDPCVDLEQASQKITDFLKRRGTIVTNGA